MLIPFWMQCPPDKMLIPFWIPGPPNKMLIPFWMKCPHIHTYTLHIGPGPGPCISYVYVYVGTSSRKESTVYSEQISNSWFLKLLMPPKGLQLKILKCRPIFQMVIIIWKTGRHFRILNSGAMAILNSRAVAILNPPNPHTRETQSLSPQCRGIKEQPCFW